MTTLATLQDLAAYTGGTADPTDLKADDALNAASSLVRAYTGRSFDHAEETAVTLNGSGTWALLLPEGPVSEVSLVEELDNDGNATEIDPTNYRLSEEAGILYRLDAPWYEGIHNYRVTCTFGYVLPGTPNPTLPEDVRAVTARIASRLYQQASDDGRTVTSRRIGSYAETFETSTDTPTLGLEPQEVAVLSRYRWGGVA